ncbi:MAG: hypothetical protein RLY93_12025 [Sumerlaeia bacterium]
MNTSTALSLLAVVTQDGSDPFEDVGLMVLIALGCGAVLIAVLALAGRR